MTRLKADLLIVLVTLIWGTTFVAQNLAMQSLGPSMFTGIRFLIGATVVAPFAWFEWQRLKYSGVLLLLLLQSPKICLCGFFFALLQSYLAFGSA